MRRGTYLTHRLGPKGPALRLADVSRRRLLDHIGEFTPRAVEVGKGRIRGLAFCLFPSFLMPVCRGIISIEMERNDLIAFATESGK